MADFTPAVTKTLANEGGFIHVKATDEVSNFGISCWFLRSIHVLSGHGPASAYEIAYVRNLTREQAVELYYRHFWCANVLGAIHDQALADKVFDLCVNMGSPAATRLLQEAVNVLTESARLDVDGELGDLTLAAVNALEPEALLAEYRKAAEQRYREIASVNPVLAVNVPEWLRRLAA